MPKYALTPTADEIAQVDPEGGPWEVEVIHRLFQYQPTKITPETPYGGMAVARAGQTVVIHNHDDLVKGLQHGAFVDPARTDEALFGEGPGDFTARPDLVEFVKDHKTDDILAYANGDADLATLLIDAENEAKPYNGNARRGVIDGLQAIIEAYQTEGTPAATPEVITATGEPSTTPDGTEDGDTNGDDSEEE